MGIIREAVKGFMLITTREKGFEDGINNRTPNPAAFKPFNENSEIAKTYRESYEMGRKASISHAISKKD